MESHWRVASPCRLYTEQQQTSRCLNRDSRARETTVMRLMHLQTAQLKQSQQYSVHLGSHLSLWIFDTPVQLSLLVSLFPDFCLGFSGGLI